MTPQMEDRFRYSKKWGLFKKSLLLAATSGSGLFDPVQHGIMPDPFWNGLCSRGWNGYCCTYEVEGRAILLTKVHINLGWEDRAAVARGEGPLLFGKLPRRCTKYGGGTSLHTGEVATSWKSSYFKVDGIREPILFTGGVLVGEDFIRDMYTHMVFHPAWKFRTVHELLFDSGRLIEEYDRSTQMAEFRKMLSSRPLEPGSQASRAGIEDRIERCFSLEYKAWT